MGSTVEENLAKELRDDLSLDQAPAGRQAICRKAQLLHMSNKTSMASEANWFGHGPSATAALSPCHSPSQQSARA